MSFTLDEGIVLDELQQALPANIHLERENPFLSLRVVEPPEGEPSVARCQCQCGGSVMTRGGGGGCSK